MNVAVASSSSFLLQEPAMKDAELSDSSTSSTFSGIKKSNPIINSVENINCVNTPKTDGSYCAHPNIERQQENITTTLLEKSDETIASPPPSPSPEKETEKLQVTNSISNSLTDEESSFSGELSSLTVCEDKDSPPNSTIQNDESSSVDNVQSSLKNEASENSNNNNNKGNRAQSSDEGSDRTSSLIKKQLSEIEREIGRRVQNKNLKKMDENEMTQLLIDHGFGNFVEASSQILVDKSALPSKYFPPDESPTPKPTLEQLRSSFSPPTETTPAPRHFPEPASNLLHYPCASFGGLLPQNQFYDPTIPGPVNSSFSAPSLLPQQVPVIPNPTFAGYPAIHFQGSTYNQNYVASNADMAPQSAVISPFYSTFQHLPQGETTPVNASNSCSSPSPVYASALPPTLSAITPEMATALLQQIQQYNPELISSLLKPDSYQQAGINKNSSPLPQVNKISATPPPRQFQTSSAQVHAIPCPPSVPPRASIRKHANSLKIESSVSVGEKGSTAVSSKPPGNNTEVQNNSLNDPVWVMRDSYLKRLQRDEQREADQQVASMSEQNFEANTETDQLLKKDSSTETFHDDEFTITAPDSPEPELKKGGKKGKNSNKKEVIVHEPAVLIEGVLFRARYLGSTQMPIDRRQSKVSRMSQAQEAVERVKVEDGERQPSSEIDLFISTEKIMVLNTDLQDILMDHSLRSISYIADIGDLVVLMARRIPTQLEGTTGESQSGTDEIRGAPRVICHVFESDEAQFIAQSIGQAFQVAYVEFLRANGIDDPNYLREINYQEVLNSQELMAEELEIFARKETQKDAVVPKKIGEPLGIVVVESGWGSMLPTVVVANLAPGGPASRSNQLNIGDQILGINGISLVGLPLAAAQQNIKNARSSTAVRLTVVSTPPVVEVRIRRPDTKYQLGFSVQNGVICSLLRGGIAERGGIRVGHRIIEINHQSVVAVPHEKIVNMLATAVGEIQMKTMPTSMFRLLTGQDIPNYI